MFKCSNHVLRNYIGIGIAIAFGIESASYCPQSSQLVLDGKL